MSDDQRSSVAPKPSGMYSLVRVNGTLVVTSALGPFDTSQPSGFSHVGRIGAQLDVAAAKDAGATAARAVLAALENHLGSLDAIERVLTVRGYLATTDDFVDHATVMDGASDTIIRVLGDRGRHARTTIGVASLPFGVPIVVELIASLVERAT